MADSDQSRSGTAFVTPGGSRLATALVKTFVRASSLITPRPAAFFLRRAFAASGQEFARALDAHAPPGVVQLVDEQYDEDADCLLDVYHPRGAQALPAILWVHGGGWVGGSKEELAGYFKVLANQRYTVVGVRYSLAPGARYPVPVRQTLRALRYLCTHGERLHADPRRIVLAGDSAGAHIAAQAAAIVTSTAYAEAVGIRSTVAPEQLRGVVLACGAYDLSLASVDSPVGRRFLTTVLWAYSGKRNFFKDPRLALASVVDHVTARFPPAFITAGNADPLKTHSYRLAEVLRAAGVEVTTLFFAEDHDPPLGHEYQFDLDSEAGKAALEGILAFVDKRTSGCRP